MCTFQSLFDILIIFVKLIFHLNMLWKVSACFSDKSQLLAAIKLNKLVLDFSRYTWKGIDTHLLGAKLRFSQHNASKSWWPDSFDRILKKSLVDCTQETICPKEELPNIRITFQLCIKLQTFTLLLKPQQGSIFFSPLWLLCALT